MGLRISNTYWLGLHLHSDAQFPQFRSGWWNRLFCISSSVIILVLVSSVLLLLLNSALYAQKGAPINCLLWCKNAFCPCVSICSLKACRPIEKGCCISIHKVLLRFSTPGSANEASKNYTFSALRQLVAALQFSCQDHFDCVSENGSDPLSGSWCATAEMSKATLLLWFISVSLGWQQLYSSCCQCL